MQKLYVFASFNMFYTVFKITFLFVVKYSSRFSLFCSIGLFLRIAFDIALPFFNMLANKTQFSREEILDTSINILPIQLNHQSSIYSTRL